VLNKLDLLEEKVEERIEALHDHMKNYFKITADQATSGKSLKLICTTATSNLGIETLKSYLSTQAQKIKKIELRYI
jgi:selenocysteine-specific translation elongation factor